MKNLFDNVVVLFSWVTTNVKKAAAAAVIVAGLAFWGYKAVPVVWNCAWDDYNLGATETTYKMFTNKCMAITGHDEDGNPKLRDITKLVGAAIDGDQDDGAEE